jgi:hypothetical protein
LKTDEEIEFMRARDDHPIFGIHGCMHHVLRRKVKMLSYSIDPDYPKKNPKVFGANGLAVGMCWAMQITALRDGAHGKKIIFVTLSVS